MPTRQQRKTTYEEVYEMYLNDVVIFELCAIDNKLITHFGCSITSLAGEKSMRREARNSHEAIPNYYLASGTLKLPPTFPFVTTKRRAMKG